MESKTLLYDTSDTKDLHPTVPEHRPYGEDYFTASQPVPRMTPVVVTHFVSRFVSENLEREWRVGVERNARYKG